MPTIEQIIETGIFSVDSNRNFHRQFFPFNEQLTSKLFAEEINSGGLSIRDAYVNFWSYEEDAELWELPKDREWRALLPAWNRILLHMATMLRLDKSQELITNFSDSYFKAKAQLTKGEYNLFFDDLQFTITLSSRMDLPSTQKEVNRIVEELHRLINIFQQNVPESRNTLCECIESLGMLNSSKSESLLRNLLEEDHHYDIRRSAAWSISRVMGKKRYVELYYTIRDLHTHGHMLSVFGDNMWFDNLLLDNLNYNSVTPYRILLPTIHSLLILGQYDQQILSHGNPLVEKYLKELLTKDYMGEKQFTRLYDKVKFDKKNKTKPAIPEGYTRGELGGVDWIYPDRPIDILRKHGQKKDVPLVLPYLNINRIGESEVSYDGAFNAITAIQQRLKPQGYNPPVKKLAI